MSRCRNDSGQSLVVVAISLVAILGFAGLAIDMGVLRYERRLQQSAADAAAIAGASNLPPNTGWIAGAQNAAATNGFKDNSGGQVSKCTGSGAAVGTVCVQVNNPPASGPHTGNSSYLEVLVAAVHPDYFMPIFGVNHSSVVARAVAGMGNGTGCVFALNPNGAGIQGLNTNGAATLNAPNCGIVDNGDFSTKGNALTINADWLSVSGRYAKSGNGGSIACGATPNSCPTINAPAASDPLQYLTPPCSPCSGGGALNASGTVSPGTYTSISVGPGNVVFSPGVYIIDGSGGLSIGANATVTGTGVTFYFTNGATFNSVGTPSIKLSAPNSGAYPGILFYQDPTDIIGPSLGGDSSSFYQGALYFPGAQLTFFGNGSFNGNAAYTIIDAAAIGLSGHPTVNVNADFSVLPGGLSIIKNVVLSE
jgi:hypothetical protein